MFAYIVELRNRKSSKKQEEEKTGKLLKRRPRKKEKKNAITNRLFFRSSITQLIFFYYLCASVSIAVSIYESLSLSPQGVRIITDRASWRLDARGWEVSGNGNTVRSFHLRFSCTVMAGFLCNCISPSIAYVFASKEYSTAPWAPKAAAR